ncbi:DNA-binding protein WhiA [Caproicibacterium sp. XB2]|uniref:DNA-binding protein WhiA n=1 Tax=Caproicibacterium sp. XB2 TaxID=3388458 RepID=UPI000A28E87A|nr:DNA-binding protein WhiA [Ruminococcaceae bacterium CPB6]
MSFSSDVKNELCKTKNRQPCCEKAECYGMLLFGHSFSRSAVSLTTEHTPTARRAAQLTAALTGAIVSTRTMLRRASHPAGTVSVEDERDRMRVLSAFGHSGSEVPLRLNRANLEGECCPASFLRGAFLSCGTVFDPQKDYRLEFVTPHMHLSRDMSALLGELPLELQPGVSRRRSLYVVYIKGSSHTANLLTLMGAPHAAMQMMQVKMLREVRNHINRRTNFETANLDKTASAAARQIYALKRLQDCGAGISALPAELQNLARLRCQNPELSLRELGKQLTPPLSRSGVNHRLQRITELSEKIYRERNSD